MRTVLTALVLSIMTVTAHAQPQPERVVSPGGIVAWLIRDTSVPLVAVEASFAGGGTLDPVGREGLARLGAALLDEGAGSRDDQAFSAAVEDLAARLGFEAGLDDATLSLRALKATLPQALELTFDALTAARFDARPLDRNRRQLQVALERDAVDPARTATQAFFADAFADHPYGRGSRGTVETLAAITQGDLIAWRQRQFTRANVTIGVAGDITAAELAPLLDASFGRLAAGTAPALASKRVAAAKPGVRVIEKDVPQTLVLFGHAGIARSDPDWPAAAIIANVLGGGGFSSRLMTEVREKRGLSYGIGAGLQHLAASDLLIGQTRTDNATAGAVVPLIEEVWRTLATDGPTTDEIDVAKAGLIGSLALRLDSTRALAGVLIDLQLNQLPIDYLTRRSQLIRATAPEDIRRVAGRLLQSQALSILVVGRPVGVVPR